METIISKVGTKTADEWTAQTQSAYHQWLQDGKQTNLADEELNDAYDSILVFIKQATLPGEYELSDGTVVNKFAAMPATTNPSAYSYKVWARDSAVTAMSYDASGHLDEAEGQRINFLLIWFAREFSQMDLAQATAAFGKNSLNTTHLQRGYTLRG